MKKLTLSVPSKTFLIGEYLAMKGGLSIILNTQPRFKLELSPKHKDQAPLFHPDSPNAKYILQNKQFFNQFNMEFYDPLNGQGGFGASTAAILMLMTVDIILNNTDINNSADLQELLFGTFEYFLTAYKKIASSQTGLAPSGADFIAQSQGNITLFEPNTPCFINTSWPFAKLQILVFKTQHKVATHEHLINLQMPEVDALDKIAQQAKTALLDVDEKLWLDSINQYADELQKQNLVLTETMIIRDKLLSNPKILAAKGCGALGADVIIVFCKVNNLEIVNAIEKDFKLKLIATDKDISRGINYEMAS